MSIRSVISLSSHVVGVKICDYLLWFFILYSFCPYCHIRYFWMFSRKNSNLRALCHLYFWLDKVVLYWPYHSLLFSMSHRFFQKKMPSPSEHKSSFTSNINIFIFIWPKSSLAHVKDWVFYIVYLYRRNPPLEISQHFNSASLLVRTRVYWWSETQDNL